MLPTCKAPTHSFMEWVTKEINKWQKRQNLIKLYLHIHTCARYICKLGERQGPCCHTLRMVIRISGLTDIPTVKNCQATSIPFVYTVKDFWIMHVFWCHVKRDFRIVKFPTDTTRHFITHYIVRSSCDFNTHSNIHYWWQVNKTAI